jgi:hypothetical protein
VYATTELHYLPFRLGDPSSSSYISLIPVIEELVFHRRDRPLLPPDLHLTLFLTNQSFQQPFGRIMSSLVHLHPSSRLEARAYPLSVTFSEQGSASPSSRLQTEINMREELLVDVTSWPVRKSYLAHNFGLGTNNSCRPFLSSSFIPSLPGRRLSRSTNTWMNSPTALTSSCPVSNTPISYVTELLPSLVTLMARSTTAGNSIGAM